MTWTCVAVLPNVDMSDSVEGGRIAMSSPQDARVQASVVQFPSLGDFLSRFYDTHGNRITPSLILWDALSEADLPRFDAMCSFRDVVATSHVLVARARAISGSFPSSTQWMDSFSIFPWMLARDHEHIVCQTPAVRGMHDIKSFRGQSSPELVCCRLNGSDLDRALFDALLQRWNEVYMVGSSAHSDVALFRSLNMAFRAGSIPAGADAIDYDYGRSVALWVSAFEILAHPGGGGRADLLKVYDLLEKASYVSARVSDAVRAAYDNRTKPAPKRNLACWLYGEAYQARNDFLHGNPLPSDRLVIKASGRALASYLPLLYRVALSAALDIKWTVPKPATTDTDVLGQWMSDKTRFSAPQRVIENAIATCLDPAPRRA